VRNAKQAIVASAVGLAVLAMPLALPNLGVSAGSADAAKTDENRNGFVKGAMEKTFFKSDQQYNVMVMNLSQGYNSDQLQGVQYFDTVD